MANTRYSLLQGHEQEWYDAYKLCHEELYYKQQSGFRAKIFMTTFIILAALMTGSFLASIFYLKVNHKHDNKYYLALCAIPIHDNYSGSIPYVLSQTDDLNSTWKTVTASQYIETLIDALIDPYGYFLREEIQFNITASMGVQAVINVYDVSGSLSTQIYHDFRKNHTVIVDYKNQRCFIERLKRNITMNAQEVLLSMQRKENIFPIPQGEMLFLRKRIVLPAVVDLSFANKYMVRDCHDKYVYILTDYRPQDDDLADRLTRKDVVFHTFFDRGITKYSLVNFNEILMFEKEAQLF
ncbi:uncharacterized protein LOC119662178 [Teleopsis dalmanni]|uniref:uncharacterized protein LOC119662178 n=1 Tax=Teleopsis dalmanni TaxID=139649 RepID=UPI0018CEA5B3|nr:uncharacterized protein LOC119662178 [Teleopsis dalmanni]